jgi:saccharopine dehydrogenase-like NADP-dependent oxidoreductase
MWKLQPGAGDITILKILIEGGVDGRKQRVVYDMLDRFDRDSNTTSMARTTGYTATATVRMIADGLYARTGISPPEYLGQVPGCVQYLLDRLAERGVIYEEHIELLDG